MKKKLAAVLVNAKGGGKLSEVWIRMMVDYYENKKLVEQTYGEYQAVNINSEAASTNLNNVDLV